MTFVAITTLPKTTHNISTFNTGETLSNYSDKLPLPPHKSSHRNFSRLTRFIQDPGCKLAVEEKSPCLQKIFNQVFGLVRHQHQFPSSWIDFTSRTNFVRPKTVLRPTTKLAISNLSVSSPESVFHPCCQMRRNTRRCWTLQTSPILFLHRLNDACRKTCSSQPKKL